MERKTLIAAAAYAGAGLVLLTLLAALPDPMAWRPADAAAIRAAYQRAPAVAAATFPGWHPEREPLLVTKGRVNYLVRPDLTVERLPQPVIPVIANGVVTYQGRDVAVVATKQDLEQVLGGMAGEMELAGGGDAGLVKGLLQVGAPKKLTADDYTGVILHEAFHVFQSPVLRGWDDPPADQSELWSRIYTDAENNRLQNEEARALDAAIEARTVDEATAEARHFLAIREVRNIYWAKQLGAEKSRALLEWEQRYEWLEGLPTYIQWTMQPPQPGELGKAMDAMQPRERVYRLGAGQALLLQRLAPGWQARAASGARLSDLLAAAIR